MSKKSFFDLKKFLNCFLFFKLKKSIPGQSHSRWVKYDSQKYFILFKKKCCSFKVIKLIKTFLELSQVMYLNQENIFSNQINNIEKNNFFCLKKTKIVIS